MGEMAEQEEQAEQEDFLILTMDTVPGRELRQALGLVWGIGDNTPAACAAIQSAAEAKGANAVVGVRRNTGYSGAAILYGTAVILE